MGIHEMYGRLAEEREAEHEAHLRTIQVLHDLVEGRRRPEEIEVLPQGWRIREQPPASN